MLNVIQIVQKPHPQSFFHSISMVVCSNTGRNIIDRRFVNSQEPLLKRIPCESHVGLVLYILGQLLIRMLTSEKLSDSHLDIIQH